MKINIQIFALVFVLATSCVSLPRETSDQQTNVSFQVFYDQLSPYGQWVDYANYGYIWIPTMIGDFAPYSTNGYWVSTQYGWAWASDYAWGWAPFHYGRWGFSDSFGWFWLPGYEWGPAWVNWLQADGYYGWSPMGPGMSINFTFDRRYDRLHDHWCFVRDRDFGRRNIHRYYVNQSDHERIIRDSRAIDRTYTDKKRRSTYVSGPDRESVQRASGRTIDQYKIRESNRPGQEIQNRQMRIYRPQIDRNSNTRETVPSRVIKQDDLRRTPGRDIPNRNQNINPVTRPITQPEKREIPQRINVQPRQQQDINQPVRTPRTTPTERTRPSRQQDVTTPQNQRVRPTQNRSVSPRQNNNHVRQEKSTSTEGRK